MGAESQHAVEVGFLVDRNAGEFGTPAFYLLYHHRVANQGRGSLFLGMGGRLYSCSPDPEAFVTLPMTFRYDYNDSPYAIGARLTGLVSESGPFAERHLG